MKRYLLFAGAWRDAAGGWGDFVESFDTVEDAKLSSEVAKSDWWHVVDSTIGKIIASWVDR